MPSEKQVFRFYFFRGLFGIPIGGFVGVGVYTLTIPFLWSWLSIGLSCLIGVFVSVRLAILFMDGG